MARLYVGTYAKYNSGSIKGAWLELDGHTREEFLALCTDLHKDEVDPELMYQDYEDFPREFYSESYLKPELFDWLALTDDDRELMTVYTENIGGGGDIEAARDAFLGKANTKADWAEEYLNDCGALDAVPANLRNYIDF